MNIRSEICTYSSASALLSKAQNYAVGSVDALTLLEARDLCEPYMDITSLTEHSSQICTTLAIILEWVSASVPCALAVAQRNQLSGYHYIHAQENHQPCIAI